MSKSKFFEEIKSSLIEREVEDVYNKGINLYFPNTSITHPFACDGFLDTKTEAGKLLKLIIEYKFDELLSSKTGRAKVLIQVVFYMKQFELNGLILPNVCMVGDINECFVIHTNALLKYLDEDVDWTVAPSNAHLKYPDIVLKIANDEEINPFVFNIDENFSFKDVAQKITDLADNVQRYVHVTEHNVATIYDYFCRNVIKNVKKIKSHDLVGIFMGVITNGDEYYQHPTKKNILVTPLGNIDINGDGFKSFFSYFQRNYTPQEKNNLTTIADRLIEDTDRRNNGDFWTPVLFTDYAHKMISEQLGEDWKEKYAVWDNCCYDDKTEVYTKDGWKLFKNLSDNDEIYSLNPYSMKSEWANFNEKQVIPFSGELMHFENNYIDLMVTPNHKMFNSAINRNYKRSQKPRMDFFWSAEDTYNHLTRNNTIYQTISCELDNIKNGNNADFYIGQFVGFYLGDGCTQYLNDNPYAINFQMSKERKILYLRNLCKLLNLTVTETQVNKNDNIRKPSLLTNIKFNKNNLSFILPYIGKNAKDKYIPIEIINKSSKQFLNGVIDGLKNSDGYTKISKDGSISVRFTSISHPLIESLERICIYLGINSKVFEHKRDKRENVEYECRFLYNKNIVEVKKNHIKKEKYNGYVYDVTLNKNHVLLVKRNGKICFSGNCGSKNLTRDYKFKELYCSTLFDSELKIGERYNKEATSFQFDFLNDGFEKLPKGLMEAFEQNKPIVFFLNPPYATSASGNGKNSKQGVSNTMVYEQMTSDKIGGCSQNLYAQFLYRIMMIKEQYDLTNMHICLFSPTLFLSGCSWRGFRTVFFKNFTFNNAVQFKASHFADVANNWGISFSIWNSGVNINNNDFQYDLIDNVEGKIEVIGNKVVYNTDGLMSGGEWLRIENKQSKTKKVLMPHFSSPLKVVEKENQTLLEGSLGSVCCLSNNVDKNTQGVAIFSSIQTQGTACISNSITTDNFDKCVTLFSARRLVSCNWINWADEYIAPNEEHEKYQEFVKDSVIYSLFESKSNQSSLRNIEYKGKLWDIKNEFFWMPKQDIMDLANEFNMDEIYEDAKTSEERYVYKYIQEHKEEFSQEALDVLNKAIELTKKSFKYRQLFADEHPEYQLEKCWDAGFYQLKAIWKEYMKDDFEEFKKSYKVLSDKMRPLVYSIGFLK